MFYLYAVNSTVPADGLALLGAGAYASIVMTKFGSYMYMGLPRESNDRKYEEI